MKYIDPTTITDAMMISSNVEENDYEEWDALTPYAVKDVRMVTASGVHKTYEALTASTNKYPPDTVKTVPPDWLEREATNRWKPFDQKVRSQTTNADSISYTLAPGMIDSLAFLNLEASTIDITMTDPLEGLVYEQHIDLISTDNVYDAWTYCFEEILSKSDYVVFELPPYGSAVITITINNPGGIAKVGEIVLGREKDLGDTQWGPRRGVSDYSDKTVDDFGNYMPNKRPFSKTMDCDTTIDNDRIDEAIRLLEANMTKPMVWAGTGNLFGSFILYGYYIDFFVVLPHNGFSECSIEIASLT